MGRREMWRWWARAIPPLAGLWLVVGESGSQPRQGGGRAIERVGKEAAVREDFVRFTNGDVLSGKVDGIIDGEVVMKPEMAEEMLSTPAGVVKEVVFKDKPLRGERFEKEGSPVEALPSQSLVADRVVLVNGESLSGKIEEMKEGKVALTLPSSQEVEVEWENVAGVAFYREEEVLAQESFEAGLPEGIRFEGGRWCTQRGWLLQADSRAAECYASLPVTQTGEVVYEWSVNSTVGRSTGMYFMASDPGLSQERAYSVRVLRDYVYVYICMNREEVHCGSYKISLFRNRNEVRLECDSHRGRIELWIDGMEVGRWESSVPIRRGKYVVLRADGRAAFDDIRIVRKGGAGRVELAADQGERDVLTLVNGDEISGKVTGISEKTVRCDGEDGGEVTEIEREKILCVRPGRKLRPLPMAVEGKAVLLMRTGDRISGELLSLKDEGARIRSELLGVIEVRRADIGKVMFRELP